MAKKSTNIKKAKEEYKTYKYNGKEYHLVHNSLGFKKAAYYIFKVDFRKIIEEENKALGFEYIKPFDFTKLREQSVNPVDIMSALILIAERKEYQKPILKLFTDADFEFNYEQDLSGLCAGILQDFFSENAGKINLLI